MKQKYVVLMDPYYVRDAQLIRTDGLSDGEFGDLDPYSDEAEDIACDMEPTPFIGIFEAEDAEEAVRAAAEKYRYDPRVLFADPT